MTWNSQATQSLPAGSALPLVVEPRWQTDLLAFAREHFETVETALARHGAVLFRGFEVTGEGMLALLFQRLWTEPLAYVYRSTPRTAVAAGVYTATEYPAEQEIPLHNENAYQRDWPMRIGFHCVTPAQSGGETPLADVARVTGRVDAGLLAEFRERRVSYVRNYSDGFDLPWQTVFQTDSPGKVEEYCAAHDIQCVWTQDGLQTRQTCQGTATHPGTGRELWFNQAQLMHVSSLGPKLQADLLELFGEEGLPRNAYFGDGGRIPEQAIAHVTGAFEQEKVMFAWRKDDVLILDNMRVAHGRRPFAGPRRVLVSMASAFSAHHHG
jgi:alpha-ketoglutarate-dependent taurine dioxygenase